MKYTFVTTTCGGKQGRTRGEAANRFSTHARVPPMSLTISFRATMNYVPAIIGTNGNVPSKQFYLVQDDDWNMFEDVFTHKMLG